MDIGFPSAAVSADPRTTSATTTIRQIGARTHLASALPSAGYTSAMASVWNFNYVATRTIQLAWANWSTNASGVEVGPGAASTLAISILYNGQIKQLTFTGASSISVADGATAFTDTVDLGFTIPAFASYKIYIYVANATNMLATTYDKAADLGRGDAFIFNGSNLTATCPVLSDNASGTYALYPALVLGSSNLRVIGLLGDSTISGVNDQTPSPGGGQGYFGRALSKFGPYVNLGIGGDRMQWLATSNAKRLALMAAAGADRIINGEGNNDINSSRTAVQLAADRETVRAAFASIGPMYGVTVTPQTSSSDSFKTAANQTIANTTKNTERVAYNNALRAGVTTSPGFFDIARKVETSTAFEQQPTLNGGVWLPRFVGDGVHPNSDGYAATNDMIAEWLGAIQ